MEKSRKGLIVASVVAAVVVVVYLSFRNSSEEQTKTSGASQTPASSLTSLTAQSYKLEKGDVLEFSPGPPGGVASLPQGSWFSIEIVQGFITYFGLQHGPDGGITIGKAQPASGSHSGAPDGKEMAGVDTPWTFFNSTGMHFTVDGGIKFIDNGKLDFSAWRWTWSGMPEINLGAGKTAAFKWSGEPGKPFSLEYQTIMPSDVPGFGGKKYTLHLVGVVKRP